MPRVVTMGDPAGCGPQITAAAWAKTRTVPGTAFAVIADPTVFTGVCETIVISDLSETADVFASGLPVLRLPTPLPCPVIAGEPDPAFAPAILNSIAMATEACLSGAASAVVTNPISKELLYAAGFQHPGHTEYLASLCAPSGSPAAMPVMMLVGGGLRVALATIHMPLMQVGAHLTPALLKTVARTTHAALRRDFALAQPKLAFTGLNPHAGEGGTIGREEADIINPTARALRGEGIDICDACPGDTVFHEALTGAYDGVIAMTHDQGLIPVKTLDMWGGVNTTLGLPIIRTSPDHGTAYAAAKAGACRPDSLLAAIRLATTMATNRAASDA